MTMSGRQTAAPETAEGQNRCMPKTDRRNLLLYCVEGVLATLVINLVNNNNNLYATRLGATPYELSLVMLLPQLAGMMVLIPGGILTDRLKNKRRMVTASLLCAMAAYIVLGATPYFGRYRLAAFLILLAVSAAPMALYNASWQAFFSDVVPGAYQNRTLSVRSKLLFITGVAVPLVTGALLAGVASTEGKIRYHQLFLWAAAACILVQVLVLRRIEGGETATPRISGLRDYINVARALFHNKRFIGFVAVAFFFHMSWHLDWTVYYYSQITYLHADELWLGYNNVVTALVQFLTIGFWARMNEKVGVRFVMMLGGIGMAAAPLCMIIGLSLPQGQALPAFLFLTALSNILLGFLQINLLQCLLQVIDQNNKTMSIAVYTVFITVSNAVLPVVGVKLYMALGDSLQAMRMTFIIVMGVRMIAAGLWAARWYRLRGEPK